MTKSKLNRPTTAQLGDLHSPPIVAERLGVRLVTLTDWRYRRCGPPFVRIGRLVRYPSTLLEQWISEHLEQPAA